GVATSTKNVAFKGWYTDSDGATAWDFTTDIDEDTEIFGVFEATASFNVASSGGASASGPASTTLILANGVATVADPGVATSTKNVAFKGWYTDSDGATAWDFTTDIDEDTEIFGVFEATVTYDPAPGAFSDANPRTEKLILSSGSATVQGITEVPTKTAAPPEIFSKWVTSDSADVVFGTTTVTEDSTFTAVYVIAQAIKIDGTSYYSTNAENTIYDVTGKSFAAHNNFEGLSLSTTPKVVAVEASAYDSTSLVKTFTISPAPSENTEYLTTYSTGVKYNFNGEGGYVAVSDISAKTSTEADYIIGASYSIAEFTGNPSVLWSSDVISGVLQGTGATKTKFLGWSESSSAIAPSTDIVITGDNMELYAVWTPLTVTVNFDGNGADSGSPGLASVSATYGSPVTLSGPGDLAKAGKSFGGWNTQTDGLGTTYADLLDPSPFTVPTTLYAVWN
ncbi:MAG: InlB B-repeat-containing protein, partial [Desulfuromonadaceae bacterium]|nr:InlB B-repeat-containing protein [Desulfuromonadaceae bacterium]